MAPSIPKTCRAVVLDGPNAPWAIKQIPVNEPRHGEILIKVEACGICHSDVFLQQGAFGPLGTFPRIPGHETIGTVAAVPSDEKKWKVGDRVGGAWHGGHDGTCRKCDKGFYQMCDNREVNGVNRDGGFAEYTILRTEAAVRIPADLPAAEYAPQLCAGITVFNGMRKLSIPPGETVAIQGLGGLGHLAVQYARKMGYRTVALSNGSAKRQFAMDLGATDYIDTSKEDAAEALKKIGGASMIVVTAPNPKIMGPLVGGLGPMGKLLILAPVGDISVDTGLLVSGGVSVHGWPSGHAIDSEETIAFAQQQGVKCMIEEFTFENVEEAIKKMEENSIRFRGVLVMK